MEDSPGIGYEPRITRGDNTRALNNVATQLTMMASRLSTPGTANPLVLIAVIEKPFPDSVGINGRLLQPKASADEVAGHGTETVAKLKDLGTD